MQPRHLAAIFIGFSLASASWVFASTTEGTVSDTDKYAWGENTGWINFSPANNGTYYGLTVTDSAVSGYAWSDKFGWINFGPTNSGQGVANDGTGHLSGSAWSQNLGWLNLSGVVINSSGTFTGTAGTEGSAMGRVSFDCDHCNVVTDWRPVSARQQNQNQSQPSVNSGFSIATPPDPPAASDASGNIWPSFVPVSETASSSTASKADPIASLYQTIQLAQPNRAPASDYVESYNAPLTVGAAQHGLLAYAFSGGASAIVQVPKHASSNDSLILEITLVPEQLGVGRIAFDVVAKTNKGETVHTFSAPLTITLAIPNSLQDQPNLGVYWFDTTKQNWVSVPNVTFSKDTATFSVDHLTRFAILKTQPNNTIAAASRSNWRLILPTFLALSLVFLILFLSKRRRKKEKSQQ